jgi:uncharacterized SAM-binding protein YcdF (DUF218 family)
VNERRRLRAGSIGPVDRVRVGRLLHSGAIGIAVWCIAFAFGVLPNVMADTYGVMIMLVVGIALGLTRYERVLSSALMVGAATIVVVALTPLSDAIAVRWMRADAAPSSSVAAVVVLSTGVTPDTAMTSAALDHLITALELVRSGKSSLLVTTVVEQRFPSGHVSSADDQARIIGLLGGGANWLRTPPVHSTRDEAVMSAALLFPRGARRIAVVTSPMHTRRACATFRSVGFDVTCIASRLRGPAGRIIVQSPSDRMTVFGDWIYEVTGMAEYWMRGWL